MYVFSFAAKFNGKVPGTVNYTSEYTQTTTTVDKVNTETTTLQSSSPMSTTLTPTEEAHMSLSGMSNNIRPALETGSALFYGLVAAGSAIILVLLLCVIGVSILVCRRGCKCVTSTIYETTKGCMVSFLFTDNTSHTEKQGIT